MAVVKKLSMATSVQLAVLMPAGHVHDRITLTCLPLVAGSTLLLSKSAALTLIISSSFLFSGLMFGPDLDIYSCQFKRWGPLKFIWLPYQKSLRHRSFWSHAPLIGTALRLVYLGIWLILLSGLILMIANLGWQFHWSWRDSFAALASILRQYPLEGLMLYSGLELGAFTHSLSDWGSSTHKRWRQRVLKSRDRPS